MTHFINTFVASHVYIGVFLLMTLESACIPIPSEITMLVAGYVAQLPGQGSKFVPVIVLGVVGNLAGSLLAYWVGRVGGRSMITKWGKYVLLREHDLDRAERWFARYGQPAVFFSRLLPVVRTFISLPAGVAEMPLPKFSLYTTLGCVPWVALITWAGYLLGAQWEKVVKYFTIATIVIAVLILAWITRGLLRRRKSSRANAPAT